MSILDLYVGRRFLGVYGLCLLGFVMLFLVVDGVAKIDDLVEARESLAAGESLWRLILEFYATRVPILAVTFAPYLTLFAAIACVMTFTRHNELAPMISAGRSVHRVLLPVYLSAVVITGVLLLAEEAIVPSALRRLDALDRKIDPAGWDDGTRVLTHLRDGTNTLSADSWFPDEWRLTAVSILDYTAEEGSTLPPGRLRADEIRYRRHEGRHGWYPVAGELRPSTKDASGRLVEPIRLPRDRPIAFRLEPREIDVLVEDDTRSLSTAKLHELRRLYPERSDKLSMQLLVRRTRPISSFVLLLLGLPFVARPGQRSIAAGLGVALGCCLAYMSVDLFFQEIGARGDIRPLVASWFAPIFFGALGLARLDKVVT